MAAFGIPPAWARRVAGALFLFFASSCDGPPTTAPERDEAARTLAHLVLSGAPESSGGATWVYRDTVDGVVYDLSGVLLKPPGAGPFPAVVVSHGYGGSAAGYARTLGARLVPWGMVVIATNYTHAAGGPAGAPGGGTDLGASPANVQRARRALAILEALGYVDMRRVAAHGHSMGAFVTTALAAAHPERLRAASHTAGGVRPDAVAGPAPSETQARAVRTPYQMHHGDQDRVVTLSADQRLSEILRSAGTTHELVVYPGVDHNQVALDPVMLERVRAWFVRHGVL